MFNEANDAFLLEAYTAARSSRIKIYRSLVGRIGAGNNAMTCID